MMNTQEQNDIADREAFIARVVGGRASDPEYAALPDYLRANPGCTVRDYKGKGPVIPREPEPGEKPWHRLRQEDVRREAVAVSARELPHNVRQAAGRDPGMIWNPLAGKYRLRVQGDPPAFRPNQTSMDNE